jgi:hypothetical protein
MAWQNSQSQIAFLKIYLWISQILHSIRYKALLLTAGGFTRGDSCVLWAYTQD